MSDRPNQNSRQNSKQAQGKVDNEPKTAATEFYQKKVSSLKHKIILSFTISGVLMLILLVFNIYNNASTERDQEKINSLNSQIADLKNKSADIETRIKDATQYKKLWDKADAKKKDFTGIKVNDVTDTFSKLSEEYSIMSPTIKLSLPEVLKNGIYNRQVLEVNLINCVISFTAVSDSIAMSFINSFLNTLPGYVIINDFSITKTKKGSYSESELVNISTGKSTGAISGKVNFSWYFLKTKDSDSVKEPNPSKK